MPPVWGSPCWCIAGVHSFLKTFRKEWTLCARPPASPVVRLSPPFSLWGTKNPVVTLCACAVQSGRAWARRGVAPAPRFRICVQSGAVPPLASGVGRIFGWVWALLVYWRHLCGMYCRVTVLGWYMCSALVGGLLVGACVGVFSWLPLCGGVVGLRSGAAVTRMCVWL